MLGGRINTWKRAANVPNKKDCRGSEEEKKRGRSLSFRSVISSSSSIRGEWVTWSMCVILENTGKTESKGGFSLSTNEKRALNHKALKEKMPSCEVIRGIEKIYL